MMTSTADMEKGRMMSNDLIRRSDAIKLLDNAWINGTSLLDANETIKQLNDLPSADRPQEWILCSEKLPKEFVNVLVCLTDGAMYVAQLTDYIDIWGEPKWCTDTSHHCIGGAILSSDIVAWMPLPKSYKGELK